MKNFGIGNYGLFTDYGVIFFTYKKYHI